MVVSVGLGGVFVVGDVIVVFALMASVVVALVVAVDIDNVVLLFFLLSLLFVHLAFYLFNMLSMFPACVIAI